MEKRRGQKKRVKCGYFDGVLVGFPDDMFSVNDIFFSSFASKVVAIGLKYAESDGGAYKVRIPLCELMAQCGIETREGIYSKMKKIRDVVSDFTCKEGFLEINYASWLNRYFSSTGAMGTFIFLDELMRLTTVYAVRLYIHMKMMFMRMMKEGQDGKVEYRLELEGVRNIFFLENCDAYRDYKMFKRRVLYPAIDDVKNLTSLEVDFEETKSSTRVKGIVFYVLDRSVIYHRAQEKEEKNIIVPNFNKAKVL